MSGEQAVAECLVPGKRQMTVCAGGGPGVPREGPGGGRACRDGYRMKIIRNAVIALVITASFQRVSMAGWDRSDARYEELRKGYLSSSDFYPDGNSGQLELLIMAATYHRGIHEYARSQHDSIVPQNAMDASPGHTIIPRA